MISRLHSYSTAHNTHVYLHRCVFCGHGYISDKKILRPRNYCDEGCETAHETSRALDIGSNEPGRY